MKTNTTNVKRTIRFDRIIMLILTVLVIAFLSYYCWYHFTITKAYATIPMALIFGGVMWAVLFVMVCYKK